MVGVTTTPVLMDTSKLLLSRFCAKVVLSSTDKFTSAPIPVHCLTRYSGPELCAVDPINENDSGCPFLDSLPLAKVQPASVNTFRASSVLGLGTRFTALESYKLTH